MKHDHFVRDQSSKYPERRLSGGGGGNRWPRVTLKITSSIGNTELENVGAPLEPKSSIIFEIDS